ncbi:MAG: amidohydrolase [Sporichthyaceae bacterium]|nr:amidohydrolase [Sporichthyaceae bacterium]
MAKADLVFTGGRIRTGGRVRTGGQSVAEAIAVRGNRIAAIGRADELAALIGPGTSVVSLDGKAVLPGFVDAHVHPTHGGMTLIRCELRGSANAAQAVERVARYAAEHPEVPWITGGGWEMSWFADGLPRRELLDAVVPDRPVYLPNRDAHGAWVNSRALELCGIDAGTPDPPDGRIERNPDGTPQGTLHEGATRLVVDRIPQPSLADRLAALLAGQAYLHSMGVTGWQDAIVGDYLGWLDPLDVYLAAARSGELTGRAVGALWWDRDRGADQLDDLLAKRVRAGGAAGIGRFRATSVKIMQDGVAENFTAAMIDPYLDGHGCASANHGLSYVDPAALREHVTALDAAGFQVHFHAIGDRAIRESLDAVAAARAANGRTDTRPHLAHLQIVQPADLARFAELGVTATMQALWAAHEPQLDDLTIPFLGPQRSAWQYPFGSLDRTGARLAAGSDWPVSTANPFHALQVAVTRQPPPEEEPAEPFLPEQALDLAAAFDAYTAGSAYVNHAETATGSLAVGMLADLVVVDRDPFTVPATEIGTVRVLATYVDGTRVFGDPS